MKEKQRDGYDVILSHVPTYIRVARWFVFKPKIQIWVNYGGPCKGSRLYFLWPYCLFYGQMVYIHILRPFGTFCARLVYFSRFGMLCREKSGNPDLHRNKSIISGLGGGVQCDQIGRFAQWMNLFY
jgi:hypothetical protein